MKFAKAYLQKEGTTTDKCASSAESDCVRFQAVALLDAVISQIARRCDLPVWLLLRAATIAFVTSYWAIQIET